MASNPSLVVVEPAPARLPEVARRQGVAGRVRLHPSLPRQVAGKRLEAQVATPLDDGQGRPAALDSPDPVGPHRIADDLQSQVVRPRKRRHPLDLDGHFRAR